MSAQIIPLRPKLDADQRIAEAIHQFTDAFLSALQKADDGLAMIEAEGLRPETRMILARFAEHLDEVQDWAGRVTLTRNLARFRAHYGRNGE